MLRVGITGGIGSGKTTVCKIFQALGISVFDADRSAKRLMAEDAVLKNQLIDHFGDDTFGADGVLNRTYLAQRVFNNEEDLNQLNQLVHPFVLTDYENWLLQIPKAPYSIREAAIMLESGTYKDLDVIILIDAPDELRIKRVIQRDKRSETEVQSIISRQWPMEKKRKFTSFIIQNNEKQFLIPQVLHLHELLISQSEHNASS
ncbi:MAG: dephospho-CoA kinase [Bacteroidetes bacterium]|jgi:dephospho-CoA kinase|nr:dephospho-CoA kinase [Bacteroidota bacterium]